MIPITYILLNLLHAFWHRYLIRKNRLIQSYQKTIEYTGLSALAGVILKFGFGCPILPLILFAVVTRMALFDLFLNLLRGKPILYEGQIKSKKSLVDWIEMKIGLPVWFFRILYFAVWIVLLIIYL
jgi:hypothetical protein